VLDGVEAEAVDAVAARKIEVGAQQEVGHLRLLGLPVGEPRDAGGEVVLAAVALVRAAQPVAGAGIGQVVRAVAGVVVDHVEQDLEAAPVGLGDQLLELALGAEAEIEALDVVGPVAMVGPVGEAGAGDEAVDGLAALRGRRQSRRGNARRKK